jgi:hypothetical protein
LNRVFCFFNFFLYKLKKIKNKIKIKINTEAQTNTPKIKNSQKWTKNIYIFLAKFQLLIHRSWCPLRWCAQAQFCGLSHQSCKTMTETPFFFWLDNKGETNWKKKNLPKLVEK